MRRAEALVNRVGPDHPVNPGAVGARSVVLDAVIGVDGLVKEVRAMTTTDPAIEAAAVSAVTQWQFTPTYLNCIPIEVSMKVIVKFEPKP